MTKKGPIITTTKDEGKETSLEFLERVKERLEKKGIKNILFRISSLEEKASSKYYLRKARKENGGEEREFIVALPTSEAAEYLGDEVDSIQVYEKDHLLETLYSGSRGIYQLPPVKTFMWEGKR
jgi:hypothetical protein